MKSIVGIAALFMLLPFGALGQYVAEDKEEEKFRKWHIKPAAGVNVPLTKLLGNGITDNLIGYDDHSFYWQIFSGTFFFHRSWGVELTCQTGVSNRFLNRHKRFISEIENTYGDRYYTSSSSDADTDRFLPIGGNIDRFLVGLVYRIQKQKLLLMPRLLFGVTPFQTNSGQAFLKEKGTNTLLEISYDTDSSQVENFTIAPAFTIGYRLGKRTVANLDAMMSFYSAGFDYTESRRNTFTQRTQTKIIPYQKDIITFSVGVGLIIEL